MDFFGLSPYSFIAIVILSSMGLAAFVVGIFYMAAKKEDNTLKNIKEEVEENDIEVEETKEEQKHPVINNVRTVKQKKQINKKQELQKKVCYLMKIKQKK